MDSAQVKEVWDKPVQAPKAAATADEPAKSADAEAEAETAPSSEPAPSGKKEKESSKESIDEILAKMKGMPGWLALSLYRVPVQEEPTNESPSSEPNRSSRRTQLCTGSGCSRLRK